MQALYIILSVAGWIWTAVFFAAMFFKWQRRKSLQSRQGFEVITHE